MNGFIIIIKFDTYVLPYVEHGEEVRIFDAFAEAKEAAQNNQMAREYGYDIFELGQGKIR